MGAWGVVVTPGHSEAAAAGSHGGVVIEVADPVPALGRLASAYLDNLREEGAQVVAVTGSTGKTSTKDILAAILERHVPTHANRENLNTEIGLPLTVLGPTPGPRRWCWRWRCAARARSRSSPRSQSPMSG